MHTRFADALIARKKAGFIPVIPDIKCTSPKEGDLLLGRDPLAVAQLLARAGAPALSVWPACPRAASSACVRRT